MPRVLLRVDSDVTIYDAYIEVKSLILSIPKRLAYNQVQAVDIVLRGSFRPATLVIHGRKGTSDLKAPHLHQEEAEAAKVCILKQIAERQRLKAPPDSSSEFKDYHLFALSLFQDRESAELQGALGRDFVNALDFLNFREALGIVSPEVSLLDGPRELIERIKSSMPWTVQELTSHIVFLEEFGRRAGESGTIFSEEVYRLLPDAKQSLKDMRARIVSAAAGFDTVALTAEINQILLTAENFAEIEAGRESLMHRYADQPKALESIRGSFEVELVALEAAAAAGLEEIRKKCPQCAEKPKAEAKVCPYCRYEFLSDSDVAMLAKCRRDAEGFALKELRKIPRS